MTVITSSKKKERPVQREPAILSVGASIVPRMCRETIRSLSHKLSSNKRCWSGEAVCSGLCFFESTEWSRAYPAKFFEAIPMELLELTTPERIALSNVKSLAVEQFLSLRYSSWLRCFFTRHREIVSKGIHIYTHR